MVTANLAAQKAQPAIQRLSWCAFVIRQNFSNRCRKVVDAGTWHDDAVAAAMSFFGDAQESPAVVFSELHVKMLALYLQFSRLDDVIHLPLKPPTLPHPFWGMEEKSAEFVQILLPGPGCFPWRAVWGPELSLLRGLDHDAMPEVPEDLSNRSHQALRRAQR
jgi:hypothetical protein